MVELIANINNRLRYMDLGLFLRSKRKFLIWLISPVAILIIFFMMTSLYFKGANTSLAEKKFFLALMPVIDAKISFSQKTIDKYKIASSESSIIETLNATMTQMARASDFSTGSLTVEKMPAKNAPKGTSAFIVQVNGKGTPAQITKFFNQVQLLGKLIVVNKVKIRLERFDRSLSNYDADFTFLYYDL